VREAHHTNLLSFVGACLDKPNVCILSSYCAKGASCTRPTQHCPKCSYLSFLSITQSLLLLLSLSHRRSLGHSVTAALSVTQSLSHCYCLNHSFVQSLSLYQSVTAAISLNIAISVYLPRAQDRLTTSWPTQTSSLT
jgi:hypothetical protein